MSTPIIRMDRVTRRFGKDVLAVDNMSMDIEAGEFISFLGPSGCGKSTALKMIAGLLPVSAGTIDIARPSDASEQDLAFVFQEPTLMPWATVFDNVYLPLRLAGVKRAEAMPRVMAILAEVGLTKFAKTYPRALSGGMKMRVSIARAMVTRPRILLMDEPFAALDEMTRSKLNSDVVRLAKEHGLTVIFVTHSVFEAVYLSSRIVVMAARPGRVAADIPMQTPWPRDESWRTSVEFSAVAQSVSETLKGTLHVDDLDH
ncbi:ABC transporter ATP-binding protein [Salipiger sp. 1_MG-2023]|uniref:ABC transporter ATP-binding protein n=1 Tax=Salipiger sp. 1_MG-2023 TaxID=3062665 RepID=UPI0026E2F5A7|nr:ABC transporter ATP-binding protein [Salipiger sp. 1_MG-2023]MDO6585736.1 ABC transporter ATP-binding protein [Salipiger sp. 1_MG-2023]